MARDFADWIRRLAPILALGACLAQEPAPPQQAISGLGAEDAATPTFGTTVVLPSGLRGDIYLLRRATYLLPNFDKLEPVGSIWTAALNIQPRHWLAGFPGVTRRKEWFAIDYTGRFWIEKPGPYRFALLSDDGSKLYIDDATVIDNDCMHPPILKAAQCRLAGGPHRIRLSYFQGPRDCIALVLAVAGPDEEWRVFSTDEFKPPANPDEWKYGDPSGLIAAKMPDPNRRKLTKSLHEAAKRPPPEDRMRALRLAAGCAPLPAPATPRCHE
jgi:hypothetical protein